MYTTKILALLAGMIFGLTSLAQPSDFEKPRNRSHDEMMAQLDLTDEQKEQLQKVNKEFRTGVKDIVKDETLDAAAKIDTIKEELKTKKEDTDAVLTDEQKKELEEMKLERRANVLYRRMEGKKRSHEMREEMKIHHQGVIAEMQKLRKQCDEGISEEDRQIICNFKSKRKQKTMEREDMMQLREIMEKYGEELEIIREENTILFERWEKERKGIREKYRSENQSKSQNRRQPMQKGAQFLLMDFQ